MTGFCPLFVHFFFCTEGENDILTMFLSYFLHDPLALKKSIIWDFKVSLINTFIKNLGAAALSRESTRLRPFGVLLLAWEPWPLNFYYYQFIIFNLCFAIIFNDPGFDFIAMPLFNLWLIKLWVCISRLWCFLTTPDASLMTDVMELWYVSFNSLRLWHIDV